MSTKSDLSSCLQLASKRTRVNAFSNLEISVDTKGITFCNPISALVGLICPLFLSFEVDTFCLARFLKPQVTEFEALKDSLLATTTHRLARCFFRWNLCILDPRNPDKNRHSEVGQCEARKKHDQFLWNEPLFTDIDSLHHLFSCHDYILVFA